MKSIVKIMYYFIVGLILTPFRMVNFIGDKEIKYNQKINEELGELKNQTSFGYNVLIIIVVLTFLMLLIMI